MSKSMTIDEILQVINDFIDEYGQVTITREEYAIIYRKAKEDYQDKLRLLQEWKTDVIKSLCKYDCNSVDEVVYKSYNKAIDDVAEKIKEYSYTIEPTWDKIKIIDYYDVDKVAEQLKVGVKNED